MRTAVIVTTYNSPVWLEKVLWGLGNQDAQGFQVVVADDGSGPQTAETIRRVGEQFRLSISHVWHEDDGFRKCAILNKAVSECAADYLVFLDGDCIPRADFLSQHLAHAMQGRFLSGGAIRLPMELSQSIGLGDVRRQDVFRMRWLWRHGYPPGRNALKLSGRGWWGAFLDRLTTTAPTFNGGNASLFKADFLRVNGFDSRMQHGGLDREFGERLERAGIRGFQLRNRAICVHLDHARAYADQEKLAANHRLREENRRHQTTWTAYGVRAKNRQAA